MVIPGRLWWLYFDRPGQALLRVLRTALVWGYGHYLIFASTAALGAGLAVAVDDLSGRTHISLLATGLSLGIPVSVWSVGPRPRALGRRQRATLRVTHLCGWNG